MRDLEESVALSLSARRFEVSKLELWLHVLSFAVSNGALITGVFGMNLLSNLEAHPTLFYFVVAGIFCGIVSITALIFLYISSRLKTHARTSAQVRTVGVSETEGDRGRAGVASVSERAQVCYSKCFSKCHLGPESSLESSLAPALKYPCRSIQQPLNHCFYLLN
jgi:hypothetical protein